MGKTWVPRYLPMKEEFENLCFVAVLMKNQKLQPSVHVIVLDRSFFMDFVIVCCEAR